MSRPWRLLLCLYLLGWVPLNFATELLSTIPSIGMRGAPAILELIVHGAAAMLCATAGWMLMIQAPAALDAAAVAVIVSAIVRIQLLFWSVLPRNLAPGERLPLSALACANALFWLVMIGRAKGR